jgi:phage terminase large subunit
VGAGVRVGVCEGTSVAVGAAVLVGVFDGTVVAVGVLDGTAVAVGVRDGNGVDVGAGVRVGVFEGTSVAVGAGVLVGVLDGIIVAVGVLDGKGMAVGAGVQVGVFDGMTVAVGGAVRYPGIRILIVRRTYPELQMNHIEQIARLVPAAAGTYNATNRAFYFKNGSVIKFGHYATSVSETEYQGQEYDWIFMDEATQFTFRQFQYLRGCLRGANTFPKRFFLTFNPGGVGHRWVKRLFIDRNFISGRENPEENENPNDYKFIFAAIDDNTKMKEIDPVGFENQKNILSQMPENLRAAFRDGNWDQLGGNYFPEFGERHIVRKIDGQYKIPGFESFVRYRAIDYGLDMFAPLWFAIDHIGRCYLYREFNQGKDNNLPELIVTDAANALKSHTPRSENVVITIAPPDLWNKSSTDGKTKAEIFLENGVGLLKANADRAQGAMQIKEMLKNAPDGKPWLMIFEDCKDLIANLTDIQSDEKDPNKYANEPHEITHNVDALRYFCISRTLSTEIQPAAQDIPDDDDVEDYDDHMTGGAASASYLNY